MWTVKRENGKILCNCKTYICVVSKLKHTGEVIGIDLGREETMIKKYQKKIIPTRIHEQ